MGPASSPHLGGSVGRYHRTMGLDSPGSDGSKRCSFCGKRQDQVARMVLGPGVQVCDECVDLLNQILAKDLPSWPWQHEAEWTPPGTRPSRSAAGDATGPTWLVMKISPELDGKLNRWWVDVMAGDDSAVQAIADAYQPLADRYVAGFVLDRGFLARQVRDGLVNAVREFGQRSEPFERFAVREIQESVYWALLDSMNAAAENLPPH